MSHYEIVMVELITNHMIQHRKTWKLARTGKSSHKQHYQVGNDAEDQTCDVKTFGELEVDRTQI
jgi:hypothetical protein